MMELEDRGWFGGFDGVITQCVKLILFQVDCDAILFLFHKIP